MADRAQRCRGRTARPRSLAVLAVAVGFLLAVGEAPSLYHMGTSTHVPCLVEGKIVFVGAHVSRAKDGLDFARPLATGRSLRPASEGSADSTGAHQHATDCSSVFLARPGPFTTKAPAPISAVATWRRAAPTAARDRYLLAPKQSPPA